MFTQKISPRFSDTDALGHINNASVAVWFEKAREPIFRIFSPDLDPKKWSLILVRLEIDFLKELFWHAEVEVKTYVTKIGNSSFVLEHEVIQNGERAARGSVVMVHFDYNTHQSAPIPSEIRKKLEEHLVSA